MKTLIALLSGMLLAACNWQSPQGTPVPMDETGLADIEPALTPEPAVRATPTPGTTVASSAPPQLENRSVFIDANEVARIDEPAPDFRMPLFDGSVMNLSDYRGEVVVLNF